MVEKTNEQKIAEFVAQQRSNAGGGDPTFNATPEEQSQFNGGTQIIRDFSQITPQDNDSLYLQNPLNGFDIYTYNIELHQVNPKDMLMLQTAIDTNKTVIVADNSREAKYNITHLEQVFALGQGLVRNTYSHNFQFEITEPNGATFMDNLVTSALINLGCRNANSARYFLVYEFMGRSANGESIRYPQRFLYPVFIQNIEMQVTGDGSKYMVKAIAEYTSGYQYLEHTVKGAITLEAATVGEFVAEFLFKYNKMQLREVQANPAQALQDFYDITFDEETDTTEWLSWPIQQSAEVLRKLGPSAIGDKIHFNIPNGSTLTEILGIVLQATKEYKNIPTHDGGFMKTLPSNQAERGIDVLPVFHKIITQTEYIDFDVLRNDWNKKVTFKVKKHIVPDIPMDALQYRTGITDEQIQAKRVNEIFNTGLLKKRYDYIFTGLNTEVLNFDIKFNRAYYVMSVINNGKVGDPNAQAPTVGLNSQFVEGSLSAISALSGQQALIMEAITNIQKTATNENGEPVVLTPEAQQQLEQLEEQAGILQEEILRNSAINNQQSGVRLSNARSLTDGPRSIAENQIQAHELENEIVQPLRFHGDMVDDSDVYGPESDLEGGTIQFGTIKANLENTSDLMDIEITVRGDPYWLGKPNSFYRSLVNGNTVGELCDYELGGPMFFLNMHLPIDEDSSGRRRPRNDYRVSGLYRVLNVTSTFESGRFIMVLRAKRDPLTNVPQVLNRLINATTSANSGTISRSNAGTDVGQIQENGSS